MFTASIGTIFARAERRRARRRRWRHGGCVGAARAEAGRKCASRTVGVCGALAASGYGTYVADPRLRDIRSRT